MELGSSSRSADSNEEFYPDLPSPQPEGATGGTKGSDNALNLLFKLTNILELIFLVMI
jgi:hypothetical protein